MINYKWISKWMGKGFKNCLEDGKVKKSRAFLTPCKNFVGLAKIQNLNLQGLWKIRKPNFTLQKFHKGCKKIHKHKITLQNPMLNLKGCANPVRNPKVHFASLCEIPTVSAKMKGHLKAYLKTSKACFAFRTPHSPLWKNPPPICESNFSLFDALHLTIRRGDLHLSPHFGHGRIRGDPKSLLSSRFYISGLWGPDHSIFWGWGAL